MTWPCRPVSVGYKLRIAVDIYINYVSVSNNPSTKSPRIRITSTLIMGIRSVHTCIYKMVHEEKGYGYSIQFACNHCCTETMLSSLGCGGVGGG